MSLGDTLQFLRLLDDGHTTQSLIQRGLVAVQEDLDDEHQLVRASLDNLQGQSERQTGALMGRVSAIHVTQPGENLAPRLEKHLKELQEMNFQLQGILEEKETNLREREQAGQKLKSDCEILGQRLKKGPASPGEVFVIELGSRICEHVSGQKRIPPFQMPEVKK